MLLSGIGAGIWDTGDTTWTRAPTQICISLASDGETGLYIDGGTFNRFFACDFHAYF